MARRRRREKRTAGAVQQLPWGEIRNPYAQIDVISADQVETIIDSALTVLETQGMRFLEDESRKILKRAGATLGDDDFMVRFAPAWFGN